MKTVHVRLVQRIVLFPVLALLLSSSAASQTPATPPGPFGEDIKKEFNDEDLKAKEERPRGKFGYGLLFDTEQANDPSVPVAITGMQSLSGGGQFLGVVKIKRLKIENRSERAVNSVQLGWKIVSLAEPSKVLPEGTTAFANVWIEAKNSKVVEIPTVYPSLLFKSLAKDGEVNGEFRLTFGVQEARFDNGTFWRRQ